MADVLNTFIGTNPKQNASDRIVLAGMRSQEPMRVLRPWLFLVASFFLLGHACVVYSQGQPAQSTPQTNPSPPLNSPELSGKAKRASGAAKAVEDVVANAKHLTSLVNNFHNSITDI